MLEIDELRAEISGSPILSDLSLTVARGEAVAVMSRQATGKSFLLEAIMGLRPIRAGKIVFGKRDIARLRPFERAALGIGYVPQRNRLFPTLTVEEHLTIAARGGPYTGMQICRMFPDLGARRNVTARSLASDEQVFLALGCALSVNPRLLLVDDIFESVEAETRQRIFQTLGQLREDGVAVIVIGNCLEELRYFANRFIVMGRTGRTVWEAAQTHILLRPEELDRRLRMEARPQ
jgi:branched-chain amino acid transport system ATP-binding protein